MENKKSSDREMILRVIEQIKELWFNKKYDEIGEHVSEYVVVARPGSDIRIQGREAYINSYRDYDQAAQTHEYSPGEPEIDIMNNTAVAVCPFYVVYELDGKTYRENGRNLLVFSRSSDKWLVVWRTMLVDKAR